MQVCEKIILFALLATLASGCATKYKPMPMHGILELYMDTCGEAEIDDDPRTAHQQGFDCAVYLIEIQGLRK